MPEDTVKFDWYQSDSDVCISYLKKSLTASDVKVDFTEQTVSLFLMTPGGDELLKRFHLSHPVVPSKCTYRVSPVKVELRLKKVSEIRWNTLECEKKKEENEEGAGASTEDPSKLAHSYPSSCKKAHDWDKLEKEAAEMEDDRDPLNKLFQNIYADGSDETRRAMIKSFTESGGTVLSTNWNEVGKGKVDMKPPDGMEFKKYEL